MSQSVPSISKPPGHVGLVHCGTIAVIEDDHATRVLLVELLRDTGLSVQSYVGAIDYLSADISGEPSCILLDVRLPGMSGLELYDKLRASRSTSRVIFMTAFADVSMCARAMKAGAFDFLQKPFREQEVLDTVCRAERAYNKNLQLARTVAVTDDRLGSLTGREREVLAGVVDGLLNKQIAAALGISEGMVKVHKGNLMRKRHAKTLADLMRQLSVHPIWELKESMATPSLRERRKNATSRPAVHDQYTWG